MKTWRNQDSVEFGLSRIQPARPLCRQEKGGTPYVDPHHHENK